MLEIYPRMCFSANILSITYLGIVQFKRNAAEREGTTECEGDIPMPEGGFNSNCGGIEGLVPI